MLSIFYKSFLNFSSFISLTLVSSSEFAALFSYYCHDLGFLVCYFLVHFESSLLVCHTFCLFPPFLIICPALIRFTSVLLTCPSSLCISALLMLAWVGLIRGFDTLLPHDLSSVFFLDWLNIAIAAALSWESASGSYTSPCLLNKCDKHSLRIQPWSL